MVKSFPNCIKMTLTKWCRIFLKVTHISERPLRKKRTARLIKGQTPAAVVEKVQRIKNTSVIKIWSQWFVTIRLITHLVFHYKKVHRQASQLFLHPINRPSKSELTFHDDDDEPQKMKATLCVVNQRPPKVWPNIARLLRVCA